MMIVNDNSSIINKLEASLTDDARVIIYDCHMFIVQAIDCESCKKFVNAILLSLVQSRNDILYHACLQNISENYLL
jgi:hypothetical protein